jgi:hypothetical protein
VLLADELRDVFNGLAEGSSVEEEACDEVELTAVVMEVTVTIGCGSSTVTVGEFTLIME